MLVSNVLVSVKIFRLNSKTFENEKDNNHLNFNQKALWNRVRSRLREMVNLVVFDKEVVDKRK